MSLIRHLKSSLLLVLFISIFYSCQSTNQSSSLYEKDENGIYLAQKSSIPKDAIRLEVEIMSKGKKENDRYTYQAKVIRYVQADGSYAGKKPRSGDMIQLTALENKGFKKGDKIKLDGMANDDAENLTVIML